MRNKLYHSEFGYLWTDRLDALEYLDSISQDHSLASKFKDELTFFIKNGYVILPQAVSPTLIDKYLQDFDISLDNKSALLASVPTYGPHDKSIVPAYETQRNAPLTKYLDTYWHLDSALQLAFNKPVSEFLELIFDTKPYAFQSLHFEVGSTQRIHQDTAYVVSEKPLAVAASWLALEDVSEGSGELMYYEGSHRLPDWKYSNKYKHYNHERDSQSEHLSHLEFLVTESEKRGYPLKRFLPKKGDVLIWSADLAHGGSPITNPELTRKSYVTHFCPSNLKPHYFKYLSKDRAIIKKLSNGEGQYSTFYY